MLFDAPVFPNDPFADYSPVQQRMFAVQMRIARKHTGLTVSVVEYLFGNGVRVVYAQVCQEPKREGVWDAFFWPVTGVLASLGLDAARPPTWFDEVYAGYLRTQKLRDCSELCAPTLLPSAGLDELTWNELYPIHGLNRDFPTLESAPFWAGLRHALQPALQPDAPEVAEQAQLLWYALQAGVGARDASGDLYLPPGFSDSTWKQLSFLLAWAGQQFQDGGREALDSLCATATPSTDALLAMLPPALVQGLQRSLDAWLPGHRKVRVFRDFDRAVQLPLRFSVRQVLALDVTPRLKAVNNWLHSDECRAVGQG